MTNTKDVIIKLKAVREEKHLSFGDILSMMKENGDYLAKSTLSKVFAEGSENNSFRYEETLRPIAKVLLNIEDVEETDNLDVQGLKVILQYKIQRIEELEAELAKEKVKAHEKLEKERSKHQKSIDFLKNQIELKDKRMDQLLNAVFEKDKQHKELIEHIMNCPYRERVKV